MIRTITIFKMTTMIIMMVTTMVIMMIVIFTFSHFLKGTGWGEAGHVMSLSTIYDRPWPLCSDNQHLFEQQLLSRRLLGLFLKVQFKEKIQIKNTKLFKPGLPKQSLFVSQVSSLASVFPALRNFKIYLSCFSHFQILYLILISSLSGCPENSGVFIGVVANFVKFRFQK